MVSCTLTCHQGADSTSDTPNLERCQLTPENLLNSPHFFGTGPVTTGGRWVSFLFLGLTRCVPASGSLYFLLPLPELFCHYLAAGPSHAFFFLLFFSSSRFLTAYYEQLHSGLPTPSLPFTLLRFRQSTPHDWACVISPAPCPQCPLLQPH